MARDIANQAMRDGDYPVVYIAADGGFYKYFPHANFVVPFLGIQPDEQGLFIGYAGLNVQMPVVPGAASFVFATNNEGDPAIDGVWRYDDGVWTHITAPIPFWKWRILRVNPHNPQQWILGGQPTTFRYGMDAGKLTVEGQATQVLGYTNGGDIVSPFYYTGDAGATWQPLWLPADGRTNQQTSPITVTLFDVVWSRFVPNQWILTGMNSGPDNYGIYWYGTSGVITGAHDSSDEGTFPYNIFDGYNSVEVGAFATNAVGGTEGKLNLRVTTAVGTQPMQIVRTDVGFNTVVPNDTIRTPINISLDTDSRADTRQIWGKAEGRLYYMEDYLADYSPVHTHPSDRPRRWEGAHPITGTYGDLFVKGNASTSQGFAIYIANSSPTARGIYIMRRTGLGTAYQFEHLTNSAIIEDAASMRGGETTGTTLVTYRQRSAPEGGQWGFTNNLVDFSVIPNPVEGMKSLLPLEYEYKQYDVIEIAPEGP